MQQDHYRFRPNFRPNAHPTMRRHRAGEWSRWPIAERVRLDHARNDQPPTSRLHTRLTVQKAGIQPNMRWHNPAPVRHPPGFIAPCLPTNGHAVPIGPQWACEIKHDG
jgi:ATP-dependent DNA ligase